MIVGNVQDTEACLRHFGAQIETLCIFPATFLNIIDFADILNSLVEYCSVKLVNLQIHRFIFDWNDTMIVQSQPLFSRLQKCVFQDCIIYVGWLATCSELAELILIRSNVVGRNTETNFRASWLVTMKIDDLDYWSAFWVGEKHPSQIEERKNMIRSFNTINRQRNTPVTRLEIVSSFFQYSTNDHISQYKKLRLLKVYMPVGYESKELIIAANELKELAKLFYRCIMCNFTAEYLLKIIEKANNLQHFIITFEGNMALKFTEATYRAILHVVGQRSNEKPLYITFVCRECDQNDVNIPLQMHPLLVVMKNVIRF